MREPNIKNIPRDFRPNISSPHYLMRGKLLKKIWENRDMMKGRLLDFGCGSKPYKAVFDVDEYIGLDFHGQGHSHANEQIDVFYDGNTIPFESETFDSIFSTEVFEHVFNLEDIIKELWRVLKPGGKIMVTCPYAIAEHEMPNDYARYTSVGLQHLFTKNNFVILKYQKTGSNFEAVMHLNLMIYSMLLMPKLNKVKFLRSIMDPAGTFLINAFTNVIKHILPKRYDLYLNNFIICEKPTHK